MLKRKKEELGLEKVCFFPFVSQSLIAKIIDKAKCCIGAIQDKPIYRFGLSLNKLNDYLISGKPVVFACNYDNVVKDAGQFSIPSNDPSVLAETLIRIRNMSQEEMETKACKSKTLIRQVYDYGVIANKYLEMLEAL